MGFSRAHRSTNAHRLLFCTVVSELLRSVGGGATGNLPPKRRYAYCSGIENYSSEPVRLQQNLEFEIRK